MNNKSQYEQGEGGVCVCVCLGHHAHTHTHTHIHTHRHSFGQINFALFAQVMLALTLSDGLQTRHLFLSYPLSSNLETRGPWLLYFSAFDPKIHTSHSQTLIHTHTYAHSLTYLMHWGTWCSSLLGARCHTRLPHTSNVFCPALSSSPQKHSSLLDESFPKWFSVLILAQKLTCQSHKSLPS